MRRWFPLFFPPRRLGERPFPLFVKLAKGKEEPFVLPVKSIRWRSKVLTHPSKPRLAQMNSEGFIRSPFMCVCFFFLKILKKILTSLFHSRLLSLQLRFSASLTLLTFNPSLELPSALATVFLRFLRSPNQKLRGFISERQIAGAGWKCDLPCVRKIF